MPEIATSVHPSVPFAECGHPAESIVVGPHVPMQWGASPTELCTLCGGYRTTLHVKGRWQPGPPEKRTEDNDD